MDMLCILAIYMAALICIVLTLFTSVVLYEFLTAAYDVVSGKARLWVDGGVRVICSRCYGGTMNLTDRIGDESNAVETVVATWNRRANNDCHQ